MIVKEECLYQGTIKGSDIDTFLVTDFIVLGKWDLLSILVNNVTILVVSDCVDKVAEQKARGNIMHPVISIGKQNFASLRENNCFYIDKSDLIRKWWESQDARIMLQNIVKKVRKNVTEADKKRGKM